jgi:hypothetical protein
LFQLYDIVVRLINNQKKKNVNSLYIRGHGPPIPLESEQTEGIAYEENGIIDRFCAAASRSPLGYLHTGFIYTIPNLTEFSKKM